MYNKTVWKYLDPIPEDKMNNIENGIEANDIAITDIKKELAKTIKESEKGVANGVAPLNEDGVLDIQYGGTGAKTAQEALYKLGSGVRPNLFKNPFFRVNQHGFSTSSTAGDNITCDMWWVNLQEGETVTKNGNGLYISRNNANSPLHQQIESQDLYGKTVTLSIMFADGSFYFGTGVMPQLGGTQIAILDNQAVRLYLEAKDMIGYPAGGIGIKQAKTIHYAKLELGETQSAAWKDVNGKWHLFEVPDDAAETGKCQRYYEQTAYATCYGVVNSTSEIICASSIFYIAEKNTIGTVTVNDTPSQVLQVKECDTLNEITDAVLEVPVARNKRMLSPKINSPSGEFTVGKMYRIQVPDNAYIVDASI